MFFKVAGWMGIALSALGFFGFFIIIAEQGYADLVDLGGLIIFATLVATSIGSIKGKH